MEALNYTPQVAAATAPLYARVASVVPEIEWPVFAPYRCDQPSEEKAQRCRARAQLYDAGDFPLRRRLCR